MSKATPMSIVLHLYMLHIWLSIAYKRGKEDKKGEAKPRPYSSMRRIVSGRPLEVRSQVRVNLVKAPPAISATAGLWGTKCGRWPTLAALTYAVWVA